MAPASGLQYAVGTRRVQLFSLDPLTGLPNGASAGTTAYPGLRAEAVKRFDLVEPDFRDINHAGDDVLKMRDALPPLTGMNAKFVASELSYDVAALLSGVLKVTLGETTAMRYGTDQQGFGPLVGFMVYNQSLSAAGARHYHTVFVPRARVQAKPIGFADTPIDVEYNLYPVPVAQELWGIPLTLIADGAETFQVSSYMFPYRPAVFQWKQSGAVAVKLLFPVSQQPPSTTQIYAFTRNGADVKAAATLAVDGITPAAAAANDIFVAVIGY